MKATEAQKTRMQKYYQQNKDALLVKQNKYYHENREQCKKQKREYYSKNAIEIKKKTAKYTKSHKEKACISQRKWNKRCYLQWLELVKKEGVDSCSRCGYKESFVAIEFHHINPLEKENEISNLFHKKMTLESILLFKKELSKCLPLCANCHRIVHFGEGVLNA